MRLLDVRAVLDREKDTQRVDPEIEVLKELDDSSTSYVILSHRWGTEVNYDEMVGLAGMEARKRDKVRERDGYRKIIKSCEQADKDGYTWLWIDTCCIDKRSSAELSEAINSMYRWYRNSQKCYVYLNDVDDSAFPTEQDFTRFGKSKGWPEWFSRGWTLQELIAPEEAEFFNKSWMSIGTKRGLASRLEVITRVPEKVLRDEQTLRNTDCLERPNVAHIMSWAADRKTTRVEDRAYSLLGLFAVNMPMLYGEGSKAFQRLQLEIIRASSDHSLFAWNPKGRLGKHGSVLADDPSCFRDCHDIETVHPTGFVKELKAFMRRNGLDADADQRKLESLRRNVHPPQFSIFTVTNVGIQVSLPVVPGRHPRALKAILPCLDRYGHLITIDLEFRGLSFRRSFGHAHFASTWPEFRSLYLDCSQDVESYHRGLRLHDGHVSWHGFTRCGSFPHEVAGDTVTFSSGNTLIVLVYANLDAGSRFAVGRGYYLGQAWVRVVCDKCPANQQIWPSWSDFAKQAYDMLWNAPLHGSDFCSTLNIDTTKNAHVLRSIWDATIVCSNSDSRYTDMVVDIKQCPGCCTGPRQCPSGDEQWLQWTSCEDASHELELDGQPACLHDCSGREIALGDYGDSSTYRDFKHRGNIFQDMQGFGIDPADSVYRPVVCRISSSKRVLHREQIQDDVAVTSGPYDQNMALHQPRGLLLPENEAFELLLKALSTRLAGNRLVTAVIQCSQFHEVSYEGSWQGNLGGALKGGNQFADPDTFSPLCIFAIPLAWRKEPACSTRREQFRNIREHFYTLANLHHLTGTKASHEYANRQTMKEVIDFSTMFGLEYLKNYVGEITFFERLPSIMGTQLDNKASVGMAGRNGLSAHPLEPSFVSRARTWKSKLQPNTGQSRRREAVVPRLLEMCKALVGPPVDRSTFRNTLREVGLMSQTLSVGLLEHIHNTLFDASESKPRTGQVSRSACDRANVRRTVQGITVLQEKLQETEDEDEQRALEEDITGKILWFYWRGICSEVDEILAKVVNYKRGSNSEILSNSSIRRGLPKIAEIIKRTPGIDLDDDMAHLQRIMLDARTGISRHKLWLSARAAEQARLSRAFRGNPIFGTQDFTSSASPEVPSTSIVQQTLDAGKDRDVVDEGERGDVVST